MDKNDLKNIRLLLKDILSNINNSGQMESLQNLFPDLSQEEIIQSIEKVLHLLDSYDEIDNIQNLNNQNSGDYSSSLNFFRQKRNSRWTEEEQQELINLLNSGAGVSEIAHILMRSKESVKKQLKKLLF